jgi:hypothetical protein
MNLLMPVYIAVLFFVLTPGMFVVLPPGGKKMVVGLTHAVLFAVIYHFTHKAVLNATTPVDEPPCYLE